MREIALDTETTGLDPKAGHRIVEIACVELDNFLPTGRTYQQYINPERDMPEEAFRVHGLSADFLAGHPVFSEVVREFLDFIGEARLVIHHAEFDMRFLNAELTQLGLPALPKDRAVDTLAIARRKFPGAQSSRTCANPFQAIATWAGVDLLAGEVLQRCLGTSLTVLSLLQPGSDATDIDGVHHVF